jgi:hypothetical protein
MLVLALGLSVQSQSQIDKVPVQKPADAQKATKSNQPGTKDNPLVVDVIKPTNTDEESSKDKKEHDEKLALDRKTVELNEKTVALNKELSRFTGYLVILTVGQLVILVFQLRVLGRQNIHQRVTERAYVFAKAGEWSIGSLSNPEVPVSVTMHFFNHGKTPAIVRTHQAHLMIAKNPPDSIPVNVEIQHWAEGYVVPQDEKLPVKLTITVPKERVLRVIEQGDLDVLCVGWIRYRDVFGNNGETGFCWLYRKGLTGFRFAKDSKLNYCK